MDGKITVDRWRNQPSRVLSASAESLPGGTSRCGSKPIRLVVTAAEPLYVICFHPSFLCDYLFQLSSCIQCPKSEDYRQAHGQHRLRPRHLPQWGLRQQHPRRKAPTPRLQLQILPTRRKLLLRRVWQLSSPAAVMERPMVTSVFSGPTCP